MLIAGYGMNSYGNLSDMALKNVIALADGEDPGGGEGEEPDPGEDGDDGGGGTICLVKQTTSQFYMVCPGMGYSIWVTQYSFECNGNNGSCSGIVGTEGTMCSGLSYPPLLELSRDC